MQKDSIPRIGLGHEKDFTWRGGDVSRLEGFSDAALAFAMTLLVVSLDVPNSYAEMLDAMKGALAFGLCFLLLMWIWYSHYIFFRRYGLEDGITIWLNGALLFVTLLYIYPLKFICSALLYLAQEALLGISPPAGPHASFDGAQGDGLLLLYGFGGVLLFGLFALLYGHAYAKRDELGLDPLETQMTRTSIQGFLIQVSVGVLSIMILVATPDSLTPLAGFIYFLLGPLHFLHASRSHRARARLRQHLESGTS